MLLSETETLVGPLLVQELYDQARIGAPSFSFEMRGWSRDKGSGVDFGKPLEYKVEGYKLDNSTTVTLQMNDDFFWSTSVQAIHFGFNRSYAL